MTWHRLPAAPRMIVHRESGRSAVVVRSLAGTSDWRRAVLDRFATGVLGLAGARALAPAEWPPWPPGDWYELEAELRRHVPGLRIDGAVVPRQRDRTRLSLIGRMAGNHVVVKLGQPQDGLEVESRVLDELARNPLPGIATPDLLGTGTLTTGGHEIAFVATTAIAVRNQRPAIDEPLRTFESDLAERLHVLPHVTGEESRRTEDLVPVHGDLTPWNLRRTPRGLALFDWESAGWGPPGSDLALYRRSCDEVRRPWTRQRSSR